MSKAWSRLSPRRSSLRAVFITFLSDFGLRDDFVGTCHGVIARIAPAASIIDITHGIEPQAVLQGALVLANTISYMPEGVHLAVVDPGVGGDRRALAVRDASGRIYVGPDNGLLVPAAEKQGGVADAWRLSNPRYMLDPVSRTFHGRDVFSPAAAHLAVGLDPAELGPAVEPDSLVRLELPEPEVGSARIGATVLYVDRYGNVQLNLSRVDLERAGVVPGRRVELDLGVDRYYATAARAFSDARPGDIILYEDSYENIAVAITAGNAAEMFGLRTGQRLTIRFAD
jgi:S-adenosylmethionine hydrolase